MTDISHIQQFLGCNTPDSWLQTAAGALPVLLIDHAHCEKKAASTALNLMFRYVDKPNLLTKMAQLAREELLHFEQVLELMAERGVEYQHLRPSRYANGLRQHIRQEEPGKLIDTLIVGGFIEARSCERFAALAPYVDEGLGKYYRFLLKSESRHYQDYIDLAREYGGEEVAGRIEFFREKEAELIQSEDDQFRFHSGQPSEQVDPGSLE